GSRDVQVVVAAAATAENLEAGAKVQHGRVGPHAGVAAGANGPHLGSDLAQESLAVTLGFVQALDDKGIGNAILDQRHHRTGGQKGRPRHVSLRVSPQPSLAHRRADCPVTRFPPTYVTWPTTSTTLSSSVPATTRLGARPTWRVRASPSSCWKRTPSPAGRR